jgi:hypothetical protein
MHMQYDSRQLCTQNTTTSQNTLTASAEQHYPGMEAHVPCTVITRSHKTDGMQAALQTF